MNDIQNRNDVELLVSKFYEKVRVNDILGPIFNTVIEDWKSHLVHLTNFWESQLFMKNTFDGNPLKKHIEVDKANNESISEVHFGIWINLWFETIDSLFSGENAQLAKNRARNMGTYMYLEIFKARKQP